MICKEVESLNLMFIEEPCPPENIKAMKRISDRTAVPIATGERLITHYGCREIIEQHVVDILQPDVNHVGGISALWKIGGMAEDGPRRPARAPSEPSPQCTSIGDNVANSGNGIVYDGTIRDIEGLEKLENFTSFVRAYHPSHHFSNLGRGLNSTMMGINSPVRMGDVVLGRSGGVIFIPAHLAEKVVTSSELIRLRDMFGHLRLREGTYTPGQIDTGRWTEAIEGDFWQWLADNAADVPVPTDVVREMISSDGADRFD